MSIQNPARHAPAYAGLERAVVSRTGAFAAAAIFGMIGVSLVALAAAFPLALEVIADQGLAIPAADLALARQVAPLWPALALAGTVNLAAGLAVLDGGVLGKTIALVVAGAGAALSTAIALVAAAPGAEVAAAVGGAYGVALIGTILVQRRAA